MNNSKSIASSDDSNTNAQLEAHALHQFENIIVFMYKMKNLMIGWLGIARWVAKEQKAVNFRQKKNIYYSFLIYELMYEWVGRGVDSRFCNEWAGEFVLICFKVCDMHENEVTSQQSRLSWPTVLCFTLCLPEDFSLPARIA